MKYEKNQYSEGFSICALIIAGAFLYWGITDLIAWKWGFPWWGFISTGIGIAILVSQIAALTNREKLRNTVLFEYQDNPSANIEEISKKTGITQKDVRAITLDLKMKGQLRGSFSTKTGGFKAIELKAPEKDKANYCPGCGSRIKKEGAQFCGYCGSNLEN
jgi:hypothetical protein